MCEGMDMYLYASVRGIREEVGENEYILAVKITKLLGKNIRYFTKQTGKVSG